MVSREKSFHHQKRSNIEFLWPFCKYSFSFNLHKFQLLRCSTKRICDVSTHPFTTRNYNTSVTTATYVITRLSYIHYHKIGAAASQYFQTYSFPANYFASPWVYPSLKSTAEGILGLKLDNIRIYCQQLNWLWLLYYLLL